MPHERFYLDASFSIGHPYIIEGPEHHHMVHVTRVSLGEKVELINGRGSLAEATLTKIDKKKVSVHIHSLYQEQATAFQLQLAIGLPRFNRLEYILEKATEIGIDTFTFFAADNSEKKELSENQLERARHLVISAAKQSGRLYLPHFEILSSLDSWVFQGEQLFFGDPSLHAELFLPKKKQSSTFFIGPEGGFSPRESLLLTTLGAKGVSLNNNTLRADTAAIVAAVFLSTLR
jgi:16S rRNA (uracil1498-N3)-methyltransferase